MAKRKNKVLITGGAGFMGSNFVKFWLKKNPDDKVIVLDKLTYAGNLNNLKGLKKYKGYYFVKGDIINKDLVAKLVREIDILVNFAAESHVDRSIHSGERFVKTDVLGTYNLLEQVRLNNPKIRKYIQISTDEVFGSISKGLFSANSPIKPNSPYSASKAGGDLLCGAFYKTYNMPIILTHSCNFFGPFQYPEKIIPLFITNILLGKKVPVYGHGQNIREWIYTEDYCRALDLIIKKAIPGEKIMIGSGLRINNLALTKKILTLMGKDSSWIEYVDDRAGHDLRYAVNHPWLTKRGWRPKMNVDSGLKATIGWYKTNKDWWMPIRKKEMKNYYKRQYKH